MNKNVKILLACAVLLTLVTVMVSATYYYSLYYPTQVIVQKEYSLEVYVDGTLWPNGTLIDWGNVTYGNYTKELDVKNTGNVPATVTLSATLPSVDWSLTWATSVGFIGPNEWMNGTLTLTVPANATNETYNWTTMIQAGSYP